MTNKKINISAVIAGWAILLLYIAATLAGPGQFWGINLGFFLPTIWRYVIVTAALLISIPFSEKFLGQISGQLSELIGRKKYLRIAVPVLSAAILLALSLIFAPVSKFLGDATLRINQIARNLLWLPTEALDFLIHSLLYQYVFEPIEFTAEKTYNLVSAFCGPVFVFGVFRLALYIRRSEVLGNFLIMTSSGLLVLFFGYVESYSIIGALLPWIILQALKVVDGNSSRWSFVLWYIAGALVHSVSAIIFSGAILVSLITRTNIENKIRRKSVLYFWFLAIAATVFLYCLRLFDIPILTKLLLPLYSSDHSATAFLTSEHFSDVINWLFLSGLTALFVIVQLLLNHRHEQSTGSPRKLLALSMVIPSLVFILFFTPHLGGARDWDLFSLPVFLLIPAGLIWYYEKFDQALPRQWIRVTFISALITVTFVFINNSPAKSVDRFESILENTPNKNLFWEYVYLHDFCAKYPELKSQDFTFLTRAWEQNRNQHKDSVIVVKKLTDALREGDRTEPLIFPLCRILGIDKTDTAAYLLVASNLVDANVESPELMVLAQQLLQDYPNVGQAQLYVGYIFQLQNMEDRSGPYFERAYELDSTDEDILINYSSFLFNSGKIDRSLEILRRAAQLYPDEFKVCHNLAFVLIESGQYAEAMKWIEHADSLEMTNDEQVQLDSLRVRLRGLQKH